MGGPRIWERWVAVGLLGCLAMLLLVNAADGSKVVAGNLVVDFDLSSAPDKLPRHEDAPIVFWGSGEFATKDGATPPPLEGMTFEVDKFGHLDTRGLPDCTQAKLRATTVPQARELCPGAIVGTGTGRGIVEFPEQAPIPAQTPLTFFNGPRIEGDPSLIVHAHLTIPAPTTYLVPLRIESIHNGVYGFRVDAKFPPIAGGYGSVTSFDFRFDRHWRFKGEEMSYIYARCPIGHLQAIIEARFKDGSALKGHFVEPCQAR
jgi:hypothetical protein